MFCIYFQFDVPFVIDTVLVYSTNETLNLNLLALLMQVSRSVAAPCTDPVLSPLQNMAVPSVMVLPLLIVVAAGVYYIYNEVMQFMSKSLVRNKVVVITDAVSGVGTGK